MDLHTYSFSLVVAEAGLEPARLYQAEDFKSPVSTIPPLGRELVGPPGLEPGTLCL